MASTLENIIGIVKSLSDIPKVENAFIEFNELSEGRMQKNIESYTLPEKSLLDTASDVLSGGVEAVKSVQNAGASGVLGFALSELAKKMTGDDSGFFDPDNPNRLKVQYNPSSLTVQTEMGDVQKNTEVPAKSDDKKSNDSEHQTLVRPVTESFSAKLFISARRDDDTSVRLRAEVFMAAAASGSAVVFQWGGFQESGILTDVNVRYTMFSGKGEPTNAEIDITIQRGWTEKSSKKEITKAGKAAEKQINAEKKAEEKAAAATEKVTGKFS
ncbi:MAG: hypothetical protein K6G84_07170 [Lachnospiraceae bacterium]|nr:hypothetical protein [Lachnospiraceae bacterium]